MLQPVIQSAMTAAKVPHINFFIKIISRLFLVISENTGIILHEA